MQGQLTCPGGRGRGLLDVSHSMLAMVGLIGSRWFGQHAVRIRFAVTILYIAAILILVGLHLFVQ